MKWAQVGLRLLPYIIQSIQLVERLMGDAEGKEKQDTAVSLAAVLINATEGIAGRDLLNDAEVQKALRSAIDAIVALQNTIAAVKAASEPTQPQS